ncbi:hypothetical protein [Phenylobacterium montanum]|uniref:DUF4870 domain-containing protein n=1 Tax=Phenylobacterium montanum TaxID=2823693 RepID=A0A975FY29_9CAUL|nr:hypothetical protein [Caulobacter sp. S6]QUD87276.1 hypothetical protein KCG34_19825 [Caulobacter sp. S6]
MTNATGAVPPTVGAAHEDRTLPAVVYALYAFQAVAWGVPALIGLLIAYVGLQTAGPKMRTHFVFQVRTAWMAVAWGLLGTVLMIVGGVLSIVLIGIPVVQLGFAILSLIYVWVIARCIAGAIHLAQDLAYPRPRSWLV